MTTAALMMQRKIDAREVGLRGRVHFIRLSARSVLRLACVYAWGKGAPASVAVSRLQRRACGRAVRAPRAYKLNALAARYKKLTARYNTV